jgi:hypothetical protein
MQSIIRVGTFLLYLPASTLSTRVSVQDFIYHEMVTQMQSGTEKLQLPPRLDPRTVFLGTQ